MFGGATSLPLRPRGSSKKLLLRMSDAPEQRRGATAPLPMTAQPSTAPLPIAGPPGAGAGADADAGASPGPGAARGDADVRFGGAVDAGVSAGARAGRRRPGRRIAQARCDRAGRHGARGRRARRRHRARARARRRRPPLTQDPGRRGGPATLMSPAVTPQGDKPASPSLAPEDAVIDVGAPAHAFMPHGSASPLYGGGPGGMMHQGPHPVGGAAPARRAMSTTFLVVVVVGGVAGIILLAGIVVGLFYLGERRKAETAEGRALHGPSVTAAPGAQEGPRSAARFGGTKARLAVTSGGAMDPEAVRAALAGALPRIDACFAAAELEPPNHETAAYDHRRASERRSEARRGRRCCEPRSEARRMRAPEPPRGPPAEGAAREHGEAHVQRAARRALTTRDAPDARRARRARRGRPGKELFRSTERVSLSFMIRSRSR